jgi:hypothetical protein
MIVKSRIFNAVFIRQSNAPVATKWAKATCFQKLGNALVVKSLMLNAVFVTIFTKNI